MQTPVTRIFSFFFFLIGAVWNVKAQSNLPVDTAFQKAIVNNTRTLKGVPGVAYWQNTAEYKLYIDFQPKSRLLSGDVELVYQNNSPDTLHQIWFKLYPNIYKKGVWHKSKIAKKDLNDGVSLERIKRDDVLIKPEEIHIDGTNMYIAIPGLLPGEEIKFDIAYHYMLNEGSHLRTGKIDDGAYFIAYFFPRIAVYDDIDGWNKYPYSGEEEFYNDFCNFNAEITVPKDYVVWATGDLLNQRQVFNKDILKRIIAAERCDTVVDVITTDDVRHAKQVVKSRSRNTFKFKADSVVDFAFALSNHYRWRSASLVVDSIDNRRTRVDAVFNPMHKDYEEVIDFAWKTVHGMSTVFPAWPFPYPHMTVFDGLDQMEYPMMANDNPTKSREDGITLTNHELFHTLFPFYMGTNETKYAWMDEGWATIGEWKLSKYVDSAYTDEYGIRPTAQASGTKDDTPIVTLTTDLKGAGTFTNSYPKPALGYLFVEEYLGESLFKKAVHYYMQTWHGKHPQPLDFFNAMNAGSGRNLNWFWYRWFFEEGVLDMTIDTVFKETEDAYLVRINNKSRKPLPVHLTVYYRDGSIEKINHSIAVWETDLQQIAVSITTNKEIGKVVLGDTYIPDKNPKDNTFIVKRPAQ